MHIRPARAEDSPILAEYIAMAESEMVRHFTGLTDDAQAVTALRQFVESPIVNRYSWQVATVAEIDGQTAGSVIAFPADDQPGLDTVLIDALNRRGRNHKQLFFEGEPGTYYLSTMAVDPVYRGRGIGQSLMAAAENAGRERGFSRASLLVSARKDRVRGLYERVGYRSIGIVRIVDVDYHRMVKDL